MAQGHEGLPNQPKEHERYSPRPNRIGAFSWRRRGSSRLPTQGRPHQWKHHPSNAKPRPIGFSDPWATQPIPKTLRPIRLQKNQSGKQAHQGEPFQVLEQDKMIGGMENEHEDHTKNSRAASQQQKSD